MKVLQKACRAAKQQAKVATSGVGARRAEASAARALAQHLENQITSQRGQREAKLARVQQAMIEQEERRAAFDEKERRRLHIPELPRGDLDEAGEERLKQLFLVRRIYGSMLARRLREDTRRCDRLEAAFQRIRAATGLADTEAIVERFAHREETLASLRQQLHAARERLTSLRDERRRLVWRLDDAQTSTGKERERRALYARLEELESMRASAKRRVGESRSRLYRVSVVLEACRASVARLLRRLGVPVEERQGGIGLEEEASMSDGGARPEQGPHSSPTPPLLQAAAGRDPAGWDQGERKAGEDLDRSGGDPSRRAGHEESKSGKEDDGAEGQPENPPSSSGLHLSRSLERLVGGAGGTTVIVSGENPSRMSSSEAEDGHQRGSGSPAPVGAAAAEARAKEAAAGTGVQAARLLALRASATAQQFRA